MIGRRPFLFAAAAASIAARPAFARSAAAAPERWIWAQNHAGEEVAVAYRAGNDYDIAPWPACVTCSATCARGPRDRCRRS